MEKFTLIVMTKSSKFRGYCVAGIDVFGNWVRLVSADTAVDGAIPLEYMQTDDGKEIQVLDMIEVHVVKKVPKEYQRENVLIDLSIRPKLIKSGISLDDVLIMHPLENHSEIFASKFSYATSIYLDLKQVKYSLIIINVKKLELYSINHKRKADFIYKGYKYNEISVTDPCYYNKEDRVIINNAIIVVSIGNQFHNKYYKFIAHIFDV